MKQFKKIAIAVVGTVLFFVVLDIVGGLVCDKLYHGAKYSMFARQNYVLNESEDDIIILGSSRAAHHYIPSIITDSLGMSCYNAGSDGMCIYYHYGVLSAMIERGHKPKMVICDVIDTDINPSEGATFTLDAAVGRFAPEYGRFKSLDSIIVLNNNTEKFKMLSSLYRYNSQLVQLIRCYKIPQPDNLGYERLDGVMKIEKADNVETNSRHKDVEPEALKIEHFNKLMNLCRDNDIKLVFFYSPLYQGTASDAIRFAENLAQENNVNFHIICGDSSFDNPSFFQDKTHLNHNGAVLYTNMIVNELKEHE